MQPLLTPSSALISSEGENCWLIEAVREQRRQPKRVKEVSRAEPQRTAANLTEIYPLLA